MEGTMAVVTQWAANFAPKNWAYCNGQLLSIASNSALFSLLGTTFGGNGQTTFGLPQMQSRTAVGAGQAAGASYYSLGETGGYPTTTLTINNIPPHTHTGVVSMALNANSTDGGTGEPNGNVPGLLTNGYSMASDVNMAIPAYNAQIGIAGSSLPYSNMAPYLAVNYIICMYGIYPSRN
ncbi:MAG: tail fiber protein [Fluviicola sp.]|nr:tail fiber protein [Fluviicola sp.]